MPAKKGSTLKNGNRNYIFTKNFYDNLVLNKKLNLSRKESSDVIRYANQVIADLIRTDITGFKLSNGIGYLCASKFKPKHEAIDWKETKRVGKTVYHLNLNTLGYSVGVFWFRVGRVTNSSFHEVYKFKTWTSLSRAVSKSFREGKNYAEWDIADFIEIGRL